MLQTKVTLPQPLINGLRSIFSQFVSDCVWTKCHLCQRNCEQDIGDRWGLELLLAVLTV